jgi:chlorite dismutase
MIITFHGGDVGPWRVTQQLTWRGDPLPAVSHIATEPTGSRWTLRGAISNLRYTAATERTDLRARQSELGRPTARCAALLPIRKTPAWWAMAQDERLAIYRRSEHTPIGMDYLPAIARRLHHSRDLGEPFDFLTWFEYAAEDEAGFDALLARLRATEEWTYVEAEIDIRLTRET